MRTCVDERWADEGDTHTYGERSVVEKGERADGHAKGARGVNRCACLSPPTSSDTPLRAWEVCALTERSRSQKDFVTPHGLNAADLRSGRVVDAPSSKHLNRRPGTARAGKAPLVRVRRLRTTRRVLRRAICLTLTLIQASPMAVNPVIVFPPAENRIRRYRTLWNL